MKCFESLAKVGQFLPFISSDMPCAEIMEVCFIFIYIPVLGVAFSTGMAVSDLILRTNFSGSFS